MVIGGIANAVDPPKATKVGAASSGRPTTTSTVIANPKGLTAPTTTAAPEPTTAVPATTTSVVTAASAGTMVQPDPSLSPGVADTRVTQANIATTICVSGYSTTVRPSTSVTDKIKTASMAAYGRSGPAGDYELDHLISLELGGAPADPKNLWPQPYERSGSVASGLGSETKDTLENRLHDAVCAGRVTLAAAQQAEANGWLEAVQDGLGVAPAATTPATPTPPPATPATTPPTPAPTVQPTVTTAPPPPPTAPPATAAPAAPAPYYANCTEARAAGVTPLHRGDPGFRSALDRDNDGIACE
jgi:hypothetical protein